MVRHVIHHEAIAVLLRSPTSGVARDMQRRGKRVEARAKQNLAGANGKPKRIDNGHLRSSINAVPVMTGGVPGSRIGTRLYYARWVHDGTGLDGPRHSRIYPKTAKALVFVSKGYGAAGGAFAGKVVVRSTRGMKPNPFLKDALPAARI